MNVSSKRYVIPTAGPMRGRISTRGLVWIAGLAILPLALVFLGYLVLR